ncbi:DUF6286 domain-containing protein [Streptomyces hygroscopicus]|uniref:DUF6286 domain-containing protein n=1 Tax=Streptomyces hygroscopicus TaxID=1912 RepID=UPI00099E4390|nr:DUF6286 domain-containing protein [Streptomyces hygroscopicus]GLV73966.1 hypothetical protein Shyhy02_19680 [Streptomyces hygroscopicus subsp. hygroscopicus]
MNADRANAGRANAGRANESRANESRVDTGQANEGRADAGRAGADRVNLEKTNADQRTRQSPSASASPSPSPPASAPPPAYGAGAGTGTGTGSGDRNPSVRVRRFWSVRRVPAGIVALVLAAVAGLLLYDVAAVRSGRPAMRWRDWLADQLATRPLDDAWVMGGAGLLAVLGVWMVVLALTPGLRGLLPMRPPKAGVEGAAGGGAAGAGAVVRAGIDRTSAGLVLRDRAMEVPGVRAARVDVGRRRIRARALAHFRDLDEVRADLDAALHEGIRQLGLARRPALSVHVRRPAKSKR